MPALLLALVLWLGGRRLGLSDRLRWSLVVGIACLALMASATLPMGHPLHAITGSRPQDWIALVAVTAGVAGYMRLLAHLRRRADGRTGLGTTLNPADAMAGGLSDIAPSGGPSNGAAGFTEPELHRYSRHIFLREIGGPGQRRLKQSSVLVIGAGGLGAPALLYLAAAGVGRIGILDGDLVEPSNLQRQVIHTDARIGQSKAASAAAALGALNPHAEITPHAEWLNAGNADSHFASYDVVLDGTDSLSARRIANAEAARQGKPLVGGALSQWEGQLSVWDPARGAPCYHCIFPEDPAPGLAPSCAEAGVLGPLPGIIGTMMAAEAVKIITGAGEPLRGRLLIWDALYADSRIIALERRADCPVCGSIARG